MKDIYISKTNLLTLLTKELDDLLKRYDEVQGLSTAIREVTGKQDFVIEELSLLGNLIKVNTLKKEMVGKMNGTRVLFRIKVNPPTEDVVGLHEYISEMAETVGPKTDALLHSMVMDLRGYGPTQLVGEDIMVRYLKK